MVLFIKTVVFYLATIALSVSASVNLDVQSLAVDVRSVDEEVSYYDGSIGSYTLIDAGFTTVHNGTQKAIADTIVLVPSGPSELHEIVQLISQSLRLYIVRLTEDLKPKKADFASNNLLWTVIARLEVMKNDFQTFEKALSEKPSDEESLPRMIEAAFDSINSAVIAAIDFLAN
ncbi:hypothetical protein BCIN_03g08230 [Botrytis cinerea B05.10]|uniref:Uncharacterized protein n=3 Tax=Botryotinia fuckeliana TaxID=40559 RepID=A0A384JDL4_BOTFB|nr:hypothetical protein BCIN_03g08230 [Botrytis cinerea B05.10]ATZ48633.1 hypothetical protein BCIN_03g08230 [Botrytis cinerea B05.10]EMR81284.1 hypothetical protein BcDW1_10112 [Botrytis cinerea BcDW1]CCD52452.1 hypothetical protein BofuT4_P077450.1 [Botrytis cinerea T4]